MSTTPPTPPAERIVVYVNTPSDRPNYQLEWRDPVTGGRRFRSARTADRAEADRRAADLEYQLNHGIAPAARGKAADAKGPMTWAEFRTLYFEERGGDVSGQTKALTRIAFDKLEASHPRPLALAAIDEDVMAAYRRWMELVPLAPVTVVGNIALVRSALRWAAKRKLIPHAPHVEMPKVPDAGPPTRLLDLAGYKDLRKRIDPAWRLFLDVGWFTGMRRTEILTLGWSPGGGPYLTADLGRIEFPTLANKSRRNQWIPVHRDLAKILSAARKTEGTVSGAPSDPSHASVEFRLACAAAGRTLKPHDLRRSFGSRYAPLVEAAVLQRLMRHASINTTMKYYVNVDRSLEAAIHRG